MADENGVICNGVICIQDIKKYTLEIIDGNLIITPKESNNRDEIQYISECELRRTSVANSKVLECSLIDGVDEIELKKTAEGTIKYINILLPILITLPLKEVINNTSFNYKASKNAHGKHGYQWNEDLGLAYQSKSADDTLREILNIIEKHYEFCLKLSIRLQSGKIIHFKKNY